MIRFVRFYVIYLLTKIEPLFSFLGLFEGLPSKEFPTYRWDKLILCKGLNYSLERSLDFFLLSIIEVFKLLLFKCGELKSIIAKELLLLPYLDVEGSFNKIEEFYFSFSEFYWSSSKLVLFD